MAEKAIKAAIYARVSTKEQDNDMQIKDLRVLARDSNIEIYKEYVDEGISGSKIKRPALDELMHDAFLHKFKMVLVWRFDRFARSTMHLIQALEEFRSLGIDFVSRNEQIDTRTPIGQAIFTIIGAIAQLERDLIRERVKAGMRIAKEKGVKFGRKCLNIDPKDVYYLSDIEKMSIRKIAQRLGVSRSKIYQVLSSRKDTDVGNEDETPV